MGSREMHRDQIGLGAEMMRGLSSKTFVTELREQGVGADEAIEAVPQEQFGVSLGAASLFVLSHPAWADVDIQPGRGGGRPRAERSPPGSSATPA